MLKLNSNIVPSGIIDGNNKTFVLPNYIGYIDVMTIDGIVITNGGYTFLHDTVTVTSAPTTSITISYFSREERDVEGNGEVTMGDLINELYDEIGRKKTSRIYGQDRIKREFNKSIGVILDDVPEKSQLQHYSFKGLNGLSVSINGHTVDLTTEQTYPLDIMGSFFVGKGLYYDYYAYDGITFTVSGADLIDPYDRILVGHRIPSGVDKISEVYVNGVKLEYVDSRDFYMDTVDMFTIVKDYQGNEYLYLPYNTKLYSCVVKFIPDYAIATKDEDILNIPYKYTRVFIYDVAYRLLASKEDERWQYYKAQFLDEYKKYKGYKATATRKTKAKIGFASTFGERQGRRVVEMLPIGIYDPYR